ncbi:MAG: DNA-3-methyladenine glycosylase I [Candidatus Promineifilaceae bacterium]
MKPFLQKSPIVKGFHKIRFNFVGPTICYVFTQAVGSYNDHLHAYCYQTEADRLFAELAPNPASADLPSHFYVPDLFYIECGNIQLALSDKEIQIVAHVTIGEPLKEPPFCL